MTEGIYLANLSPNVYIDKALGREDCVGIPDRIIAKVTKTDGCWLWTGTVNGTGYASAHCGRGRTRLLHRFFWEETFGPIPDGQFVLHRCDVRHCVRPDHLFLGTHTVNMQDCVAKRRHAELKKTHCPQGHEYTEENTYWYPKTARGQHRGCRECIKSRRIAKRKGKRTHCKRGHAYTPDNVITWQWEGKTWRRCRICQNINKRARRSRANEAA